MFSSSFCLSLFEISLDRRCATPSVILGEEFQKSLTFTRSTKNKNHFSPLRKKPSLKKRGDLSLSISSLLLLEFWVIIFHWFKKILQHTFNFLPVHSPVMVSSSRTSWRVDDHWLRHWHSYLEEPCTTISMFNINRQ